MFDSASVNSISSIPSPVYLVSGERRVSAVRLVEALKERGGAATHQWRKALRLNMAENWVATREKSSWIAVD
jgi:hypothetical protein